MLRSLAMILAIAKEGYNDPLTVLEGDLAATIQPMLDAYNLTSGRRVHVAPGVGVCTASLSRRALAALVTIVESLVDNATRNSPLGSEVTVQWERGESSVVFDVANEGSAVVPAVGGKPPEADRRELFKGLPRSYQLAERNGWELKYQRHGERNHFRLEVPLSAP